MSDHETAAAVLFGETHGTEQTQKQPTFSSALGGGTSYDNEPQSAAEKLFGETMNKDEDLGVFAPDPKDDDPEEAETEVAPWNDGLSEAQMSQVEAWGVTETDIQKFDDIVDGLKPGADIDDLIYAAAGFLNKYQVSEDEFKAWIADELAGDGPEAAEEEPDLPEGFNGQPATPEQRAEWTTYAQKNFDSNELTAAEEAIRLEYGDEDLAVLGASGWGAHPQFIEAALELAIKKGLISYE